MHWLTLSKVSREVDREVDCEAAYYHPERVWKLPCFDPFSKQTAWVLATVEAFWPHWLSEPEDLFFWQNPFQLNTGTKTLLLVETLSPINGELGPCRQYWLLLLFCGLRPPRLLLTPPLESRSHPHTLTVVLTESCFNENQFYKWVQFINFNIFDISFLAHLTQVPETCV